MYFIINMSSHDEYLIFFLLMIIIDLKPLVRPKPSTLSESEAVCALEQIFLSSEEDEMEKLMSRDLFQSLQRVSFNLNLNIILYTFIIIYLIFFLYI